MTLSNSVSKSYYPGLDLLKFILALLIIAAHCNLAAESSLLKELIGKITSIAVPLFFAISSFLFFGKIDQMEEAGQRPYLNKTIKRLLILFILWYALMFPMTWQRFWRLATLKESVYAILLSCSFNGYWFIKALIINTILLFLCRRGKGLVVFSAIALLVYLFWSYNYVYEYVSIPFSPYYSFYYHTAYFCSGALLARYYDKLSLIRIPSGILIIIYLVVLLGSFFMPIGPIYRLISVFLIFPVFERMSIQCDSLFTFRKMSIILYMVQFLLIWLYGRFSDSLFADDSLMYITLHFSLVRYLIVTMTAIAIAGLILWLEKKPRLSFLSFLH